MRFIKRSVFVLLMLALTAVCAQAQRIKLASIAPQSSPWGAALNKIAAEWSRISGGKVELVIYHDGVAGDEPNMMRKLRMGQIQGAVFTSLGLMDIAPEVMTLSYPLLIRDDAELDYVMERLFPLIESSVAANNFVAVTWSKAGWVRFFSKEPVITPTDLKQMKLISNPDDPMFYQVWAELGYNQVPVSITDTLMALNSGKVNVIWASPLAVAGYQWFGIAKHMTNLNIAPFIGAFVMTKAAWQSIPDDLRPALMKAAHDITKELDKNLAQLESSVFRIMMENGLIIHNVPADALELWEEEFNRGARSMMGKTFSLDIFNKISGWLSDYRRK